MREAIISVVFMILASCLLRSSEAVTCTADNTIPGCTDCSNVINISDPECAAEAAANIPSSNNYFTTPQTTTAQWGQSRFPWHKVKNMLLMF